MSAKWFTMASPTMFNAGTRQPQMSSCFLLTMAGDSIDGIYETLTRCALISKSSGGVGLNVSSIRASGSYIRGTNGNSNGLVPMLRVFNNTARFVNQGGGKRRGSFAVYLEPWHADIFSFLDLRKNTGKEELRARDLFYALWVPDVFMKRVQADGAWPLFCPNECPGLADSCGPEFEALFLAYEAEGKARKTVKAQELWFAILDSQIETGTPYMLYKDACNLKSNQKHLGTRRAAPREQARRQARRQAPSARLHVRAPLRATAPLGAAGTIKGSNLCTEIIQYTSPDEVAVCNLASIALPMFVRHARTGAAPSEPSSTLTTPAPEFDHAELVRVAKVCVRNLNRVIDGNYYPVPEARTSNMRHRPVGLGVQGLADTFIKMRCARSARMRPRPRLAPASLRPPLRPPAYRAALAPVHAKDDGARARALAPDTPGSRSNQTRRARSTATSSSPSTLALCARAASWRRSSARTRRTRARPSRRASCSSTCGASRRPIGTTGRGCAPRSRRTACAIRCSSRRCPPPRPRRSWATTSASSRTRPTCTRGACSRASSPLSTRSCSTT